MRRRLDRRDLLDFVSFGTSSLEILLHVGLQVPTLRAKDRLHTVTNHYHSGRAERLELVRVGFAYVVELHAQPGDARIEAGDIASPTECAHQLQSKIVTADATGGFHSFVFLTSGSEQVKAPDRIGEDTVIHCRPDRADDQEP